jgi:hypothetical protein
LFPVANHDAFCSEWRRSSILSGIACRSLRSPEGKITIYYVMMQIDVGKSGTAPSNLILIVEKWRVGV